MENASLAIRMAGGVLIALLIIGVFISVMVVINNNQQQQQDEEELKQVSLFNESYSSFENRIIDGYKMLSLINKAIDYNKRMTNEMSTGGESFTPIHIYVKLTDSEKLPNQGTKTENRSAKDNNYIDLNDYYNKKYTTASTEQKNEFKNMYFAWEKTERVRPDATDANGNRLGDVDGVGKIYEMYFIEYVK